MLETFRNMCSEMKMGHIEKEVKNHLTRVYTCMGLCLIACSVGSYLHITGFFTAGVVTMVGLMLGALALMVVPATEENETMRFSLLMTVSLFTGIDQGPLLKLIIEIDHNIVMTAFLASALIFVCFSLASLTSEDRKWLSLGGVLFSALSWLILFGLLNMFLHSTLIFELRLYVGLAVFCGFVLYDTQLIIEKSRDGDNDYIGHCLALFLDFINIFRSLLILLGSSKARGRRQQD